MTLYERISSDMISALKNKDKESLSTIRLLKGAIDLNKINNQTRFEEVKDEAVIEVVSKQIKTHKESIEQFKSAGRNDLVTNLEREIELLSAYLPEQLTKEEIEAEIDRIIEEVKPTGKQDLGKVMKEASRLKGKADFKLVSEIVQSKLN
jgi:uncharacterized protein YqeY